MAAKLDEGSSNSPDKTMDAFSERLKKLYPAVDETETPLPKQWNAKDKFSYLGLSQNNLRVHYKGTGKNHKDAASVRATHPIPAACGIYYFEVKVISKGRDGYMGIGLSVHGVNLNRLPGWDKSSYGYHGDDGHSFCSSGTGADYGPTFSTGDVIGCCVNLIENTCFYTKNGVNLGIAFRDLPGDLYPTVGLQTPGEIVEANFGQHPFVFDIEDYIEEWRRRTTATVVNFPVPFSDGEWHTLLQKMVTTYLVHYGYCSTAEVFAKTTGQAFQEELASIKNRQRIQQKVLLGQIGDAIELTHMTYPGLLDQKPWLHFLLKCRQFIEMIGGADTTIFRSSCRSPKSQGWNSPCSSPSRGRGGRGDGNSHIIPTSSQPKSPQPGSSQAGSTRSSPAQSRPSDLLQPTQISDTVQHHNSLNTSLNGNAGQQNGSSYEDDAMDTMEAPVANGDSHGDDMAAVSNGSSTMSAQDNTDPSDAPHLLFGGHESGLERVLQFGRELNKMAEQLKHEENTSQESVKKLLKDAFSLLAYADPWSSPVGWQLEPEQRESVSAALNSAILESQGLPKQPPLELCIGQVTQCLRHMARSGVGSCAFASLNDYLQ